MDKEEYILSLPLYIDIPRKKGDPKRFYLNLNQYRNAHYFILNTAKKLFEEQLQAQLQGLPVFSKVELFYTVYPAANRSYDVSNVCSVVDKFFCDALVNAGKIKDDSIKYLSNVHYSGSGSKSDNPRVDVRIQPV